MSTFKQYINTTCKELNTDISSLCIVFLSVFAVFCHYKVTSIILLICSIWVLLIKGSIKKIFNKSSPFIAFSFLLMTAITAIYYKNTKGLWLSFIFTGVAIIGFYLQNVVTKQLFEHTLFLIQFACIAVFIGCIITKIIHINEPPFRYELWFRNCNYLGTLMAACALICAYKQLMGYSKTVFNCSLFFICCFVIYLSGSLFAIIELLVSLCALLALNENYRLLGIFLAVCVIGCMILFTIPQLMPRLSESTVTTDNRILIWKDSIRNIPNSFLFGKGFFAYKTLPDRSYPTSHSHNFVLDSLLSFGIVGTLLLGLFFITFYRNVFLCNQKLTNNKINCLILALSAGVLLHATTDMTMLWSQTSLFYALILSGIGADQRDLELLNNN